MENILRIIDELKKKNDGCSAKHCRRILKVLWTTEKKINMCIYFSMDYSKVN